MQTKSVTVHGDVDKPPAGRLDFIFYCTDDPYAGWYRVHLTPQHLLESGHLLVQGCRLRLVVDIDREKGEMFLHSAALNPQAQPAE
jgi:hypothetical protein